MTGNYFRRWKRPPCIKLNTKICISVTRGRLQLLFIGAWLRFRFLFFEIKNILHIKYFIKLYSLNLIKKQYKKYSCNTYAFLMKRWLHANRQFFSQNRYYFCNFIVRLRRFELCRIIVPSYIREPFCLESIFLRDWTSVHASRTFDSIMPLPSSLSDQCIFIQSACKYAHYCLSKNKFILYTNINSSYIADNTEKNG